MSRHTAGKKLKRRQYKQVAGEFYGTPKEVWGFQTSADSRSAEDVARAFLKANTDLFGRLLDRRKREYLADG
jgi:hypothetical protein